MYTPLRSRHLNTKARNRRVTLTPHGLKYFLKAELRNRDSSGGRGGGVSRPFKTAQNSIDYNPNQEGVDYNPRVNVSGGGSPVYKRALRQKLSIKQPPHLSLLATPQNQKSPLKHKLARSSFIGLLKQYKTNKRLNPLLSLQDNRELSSLSQSRLLGSTKNNFTNMNKGKIKTNQRLHEDKTVLSKIKLLNRSMGIPLSRTALPSRALSSSSSTKHIKPKNGNPEMDNPPPKIQDSQKIKFSNIQAILNTNPLLSSSLDQKHLILDKLGLKNSKSGMSVKRNKFVKRQHSLYLSQYEKTKKYSESQSRINIARRAKGFSKRKMKHLLKTSSKILEKHSQTSTKDKIKQINRTKLKYFFKYKKVQDDLLKKGVTKLIGTSCYGSQKSGHFLRTKHNEVSDLVREERTNSRFGNWNFSGKKDGSLKQYFKYQSPIK